MIDFTMVLGLDEAHADQLVVTYPSWAHFKPELATCPVLAICDAKQIKITHPVFKMLRNRDDFQIHFWDPPEGLYDTQRENMLTALTVIPGERVKTPWYLKIDTDVFATNSDQWIFDEWFEDNPAFISSPWGYTKPNNAIEKMDAWADSVPMFSDSKPLNIPYDPKSNKVKHSRIISFIYFGNTEWTKNVTSPAKIDDQYKLPVPSQDTYLFYCAKRLGSLYRRPKFKKFGWVQGNRTANIVAALKELPEYEMIVDPDSFTPKVQPKPEESEPVIGGDPTVLVNYIGRSVAKANREERQKARQEVKTDSGPQSLKKPKINAMKSTGTHLPVLLSAFAQTKGNVLELGCGHYSTPMLHSLCVPLNRQLLTIESNPKSPEKGKEYFKLFEGFANDHHKLIYFNKWEEFDFDQWKEGLFWDVALVDAEPPAARVPLIRKIKDVAKFIVCHDSEEKHSFRYHYEQVVDEFKYVFRCDVYPTETMVLSNFEQFSML